MTSSSAQKEFRTGPVYFFDQPPRRIRLEGTQSNILHHEGAQLEETIPSHQETGHKESNELAGRLAGAACWEGKPDTLCAVGAALNIMDQDPLEAYKRSAPQLLGELASLLSLQNWAEEFCIPQEVLAFLDYSWQDLCAAATLLMSRKQAERRRRPLKTAGTPCKVSTNGKMETGEGSVCPSERQAKVGANPRNKKQKKEKPSKAAQNNFSVASFSLATSSTDAGWIIQPMQPSSDESQLISLCQWLVERLREARKSEKRQTAAQDLSSPLILRHYRVATAKVKDSQARRKAPPATLVNGIPQIPEVKLDPAQQKLHYGIDDGSSFIYYPSGCVAVCQSHSALPCGGFFTNVFSDGDCPVILATVTAYGHGAVSSSVEAVWNQDAGYICDIYGNNMKEWSWQSEECEEVVIQVLRRAHARGDVYVRCKGKYSRYDQRPTDEQTLSVSDKRFTFHPDICLLSDQISVRLLSGTSAILSFMCNNESVQLPLPVLTNTNQSKEMVSVCSQMVRKVDGLEEPLSRRAAAADRELKKLQQKIQNILDDWLEWYRVALGVRCPDTEQMPDSPLRTRPRREVQSVAPSLSEWAVQPEERTSEPHGHLSAQDERPADSSAWLPRSPKKRVKEIPKEEPQFTQIRPLQLHGRQESVTIPKSPEPDSDLSAPPPPLAPSAPLAMCPEVLRAALLGEGVQRRCSCSITQMPAVTDVEFDTFVMGQPPHSQQILVVCVTLPRINPCAAPDHDDALEQLYSGRNKHRTMPCTQSQMDSFRLVRYEMSTVGSPSCGCKNVLLQQRHNAAPGMILMYVRGTLLFVGYSCNRRSFSVMDLQKQISKARGDYRLGLSLPSDYKFSNPAKKPAAKRTTH